MRFRSLTLRLAARAAPPFSPPSRAKATAGAFAVGDRVIDRETGEAGIVVKMPRDLAREHPQLVVVLFDGTEDGVVYHRADKEHEVLLDPNGLRGFTIVAG
jgi:hypothetical protein